MLYAIADTLYSRSTLFRGSAVLYALRSAVMRTDIRIQYKTYKCGAHATVKELWPDGFSEQRRVKTGRFDGEKKTHNIAQRRFLCVCLLCRCFQLPTTLGAVNCESEQMYRDQCVFIVCHSAQSVLRTTHQIVHGLRSANT